MTEAEVLRHIGESVLMKRRRLGLSQEQLAADAGLRASYVSDIERGKRNFSVMTLLKIAQALSTSPDKVLNLPDGVQVDTVSTSE